MSNNNEKTKAQLQNELLNQMPDMNDIQAIREWTEAMRKKKEKLKTVFGEIDENESMQLEGENR
jgi:hypothetical protein